MRSTLLLSLVAIAAGQVPTPDLRQLPLDEVIARLSPVGCERQADEELRRRLKDGVRLSDEQWRRALLAAEVIRYRKRWPSDRPFGIGVYAPSWINPVHVRVVPREPPAPPMD